MSTDFYTLKVVERIPEGNKAVSIVFEIPTDLEEHFRYQSGQYLTLRTSINGESVRRAYSLSSYPNDGNRLKVSVKKVDGGLMSTYLFDTLRAGDEMEVMPPMGSFVWNESNQPLVLFAAGSGITPLISILKTALDSTLNSIYLFYGNRTEEEAMFLTELNELKEQNVGFHYQTFFSSKSERLDESRVKQLLESNQLKSTAASYYICGPNGMIESVKNGLQAAGIADEAIHIEYFSSPKEENKAPTVPVSGDVMEVTLILDDETREVTLKPNETILEAGERIGIDPPFSCQSGVCTSCKAKLLQGEVHMENNFGLDQDEVDEGFILPCIANPVSPGVVVSWDE